MATINVNTARLTLRELKKMRKHARKRRGNPQDSEILLQFKSAVAGRDRKYNAPKPKRKRA